MTVYKNTGIFLQLPVIVETRFKRSTDTEASIVVCAYVPGVSVISWSHGRSYLCVNYRSGVARKPWASGPKRHVRLQLHHKDLFSFY